MSEMNRRELGLALSAFAMLGSLCAEGQGSASAGDVPKLVHSEVFSYDKLPVKTAPNGMTVSRGRAGDARHG